MEYTRIASGAAQPTEALSPQMLDALALHGLRELVHTPIVKVARALAHFDREQLGIAIEVMVAMLDVAEGDSDLEDATNLEDDHVLSPSAERLASKGPGCAVSDAPDPSVTEWHTRGRHKLHDGLTGKDGWRLGEDDEDDDPDHGLDEGEPNFVSLRVPRGEDPGCHISDPGEECGDTDRDEGASGLTPEWGIDQRKVLPEETLVNSDRQVARPHRDRIRREACRKLDRPDARGRRFEYLG